MGHQALSRAAGHKGLCLGLPKDVFSRPHKSQGPGRTNIARRGRRESHASLGYFPSPRPTPKQERGPPHLPSRSHAPMHSAAAQSPAGGPSLHSVV